MTAVTNWAGNVAFAATRIHRPESVDALRRLVAGGARIRALGSGHSFSLIADTPAELVRLDGLPATVEIDGTTVTVAAGMRYAEVATALDAAGLALPTMASLPHISVAGSCATATHGSGDSQRCLAASVASLRLVTASGDIVTVDREADQKTFPGSVVALGALGVVTHLTLDVEPAFQVAQHVRLDVPLDEIAAGFDAVFGAAYSVSVFTDWRSGQGAVWLKRRTDRPAPEWSGGRPAAEQVHPIVGQPPESSTRQLGVPGPWHRRLPHFRPEFTPSAGEELQSEWLLPREQAPAALAAVRTLADRIAPHLHISEIRTIRADDLWLSPAYGRDSVALHFTWLKDPAAVQPLIAALDGLLLPLGARPHWGKLTTVPPADLLAAYPRGADFARLAREADPDGKFRNPFLDALVAQ